jgi:ectoine hydroxylase-related dioxygenase (phytanoyl-CoA dioxygenase family)
MIEMYQHQALWDNRQHPRVHQAFAELLGTEKLWVSFDRVGLKPPAHPDHPEYVHKGFIHWDTDTSKLSYPLNTQHLDVQGVLCLTDTSADMGGFQCIPGFHNDLEEWIKTQPPDRKPHAPDLKRLPAGRSVQPVPARAGDLIIWNRLLAHGNGHNTSNKPRLAQYLTMFPAGSSQTVFGRESEREERIRQWRERCSPQASWAPGDPRRWEQNHGTTAELTPLGRRLLGLDLWD